MKALPCATDSARYTRRYEVIGARRMPRITPDEAGGANVCIYALVDPRDGALRYVGASKHVAARVVNHMNTAYRYGAPRCLWFRELLTAGLQPTVVELQRVGDDIWEAAEQYWIEFYRSQGARLTNLTAGGLGWMGHTHTQREKDRIGAAHAGKVVSGEQRAKISAAHCGKALSKEHKRAISRTMKGRTVSDETRQRISAAKIGRRGKAGAANSRAKLTEPDVLRIRASTATHAALAREFGVSDVTIHGIRTRRLWGSVA